MCLIEINLFDAFIKVLHNLVSVINNNLGFILKPGLNNHIVQYKDNHFFLFYVLCDFAIVLRIHFELRPNRFILLSVDIVFEF